MELRIKGKIDRKVKEFEHAARNQGYTWGIAAILVPALVLILIDSNVPGGFDEYTREHNTLGAVVMALCLLWVKLCKHLGVNRHKPEPEAK